jgi:hypothetical protein
VQNTKNDAKNVSKNKKFENKCQRTDLTDLVMRNDPIFEACLFFFRQKSVRCHHILDMA